MRQSLQILDNLIFKLETNLGKQHKYAPAPVQPAQSQPEPVEVQPGSSEAQPEPVEEAEEPKVVEEVKQASAPTNPAKEVSPFELWSKIDIRVGRLIEVWKHPDSAKLYCEKIDLGEGSVREIASGLQEKIEIEGMTGLVLVMANLKARKLAGFNSNGMVLCASKEGKVALLRPPEGSQVGEKVALESEELPGVSRSLPTLNPKHKVLESALPLLKTDSNGHASFSNQKLRTSAGWIVSEFADSPIS